MASNPEAPGKSNLLAGAGHPYVLARLDLLHRDRGIEHHRLGRRRGLDRRGLTGIASRPKHDTQNQQAVTARGIHEFMAARRYSLYPHPANLFLLNLAPAQTPASATSHTRPARRKKVFIPHCVSGSIFFYKVKNISGIVDKVGLGDPAAWPVYRDTL